MSCPNHLTHFSKPGQNSKLLSKAQAQRQFIQTVQAKFPGSLAHKSDYVLVDVPVVKAVSGRLLQKTLTRAQ